MKTSNKPRKRLTNSGKVIGKIMSRRAKASKVTARHQKGMDAFVKSSKDSDEK